jgi:predicted  nucleic acid-binding Zn-ribbon protein
MMISAAEDIGFLIQIVQKDYEIVTRKKFLETSPSRISDLENEISKMDEELQKDLDVIAGLESERKSLSGKIAQQNTDLVQKKLDREKLKTNKEYKAMGKEIEYLIDHIDQEEEQILVNLDKVVAAEKELDKIKARIDSEKDDLLDRKNELDEEVIANQDKLQIIQDEKIRILPHLSEKILRRYERILKAKGDSGVANLAADVCQGCFSRVPPQKAHEIRRNDQLITCEDCGRILVYYSKA